MNKEKNYQDTYSGIKISDSISLSLPRRRYFPDFIPLILIAICGCIGTVNAFSTMFHLSISGFTLNFYTIIFALLFSVIFILPKKAFSLLIPLAFVYEFLIYCKWDSYLNGFTLVYNQVYKTIWPRRSDYFRIDPSEVSIDSDIKVFISFTVFILAALICYISIVKPNFLLGFLLTFPLIEVGLYYGKSPDILPVIILITYWTSLLAVNRAGYSKVTGRSKTGFIRHGNSFIAKPSIRSRTAGQTGIIMLLLSSSILTVAFAAVNLSGYRRPEKLENMRENVKTAISEFSFDDLSGSIERLSDSFRLAPVKIHSYRLGRQESVSFDGKTDLTVTATSDSPIPTGNIYLKSYVGSVYDGKSWSEQDKSVYEKNAALFNEFGKSVQYPQNMLFNSYGRDMEMMSDWYPPQIEMTVKSEQYLQQNSYTPYNSRPKNDVEYVYDTLIEQKNKKLYSFDVSPYQDYDVLFSSADPDYDSEYRDFVYSHYLDVPNNDEIHQLYSTFIEAPDTNDVNSLLEYVRDNPSDSTFSQLNYIKKVLEKNAEYSLKPGKTPSGRDFVSYFLLENHKGYCVHFATAGIILARMSGIPARYVTGYVMLSDDFSEKNKTEDGYKIEIDDSRAHAWAEIYIDGYGWVPYEFTPGSAAALNYNPETTKPTNPTVTTTKVTTPSRTSTTTLRYTMSSAVSSAAEPHNSKKESPDLISVIISKVKNSSKIQLAIASSLILIMVITVTAAVHCITIRKRKRSFNTDNPSQNAINAYRYIIRLLEFCDVKPDNMQYLEFAEYAELNTTHIFSPGEFRNITDIALEAALSGHRISNSDAEKVVRLSVRTAGNIFRQKNILERFYMKFIRNLI